MEKHILEQYIDTREEERDLVRRIYTLQEEILKMEMKGSLVADSVTCGKKGKKPLGTRKIQGFPIPEYEKKRERLKTYQLQLELADQKLLTLLTEVEEYIENIEDSRIRRIMRYRYIDGMSWTQVAHWMGRYHTAESCRRTHDRYLEENIDFETEGREENY